MALSGLLERNSIAARVRRAGIWSGTASQEPVYRRFRLGVLAGIELDQTAKSKAGV